MEIPRDLKPTDPLMRRRAADEAKRLGKQPSAEASTGAVGDAVATPANEAVTRYVAMLKAHSGNPEQLEALRRALEDGSFTATPEELVDPLLDTLDESRG
jgi:hypothetical protein